MDGKIHFSELYLPDEERVELEEEYGEEFEDIREELEEEFMEHYTYDPITKEYEGRGFVEDCTGKTFVVTGKLEMFENHEELAEYIEELGGKAVGSVSSKTDYLISNDTASTSSKMKKAKELGVEIITEEVFIQRFGDPDEFDLDEEDETD